MNIPVPAEPAESIPTEQDEFVAYLVNFYRHSLVAARRAVEEYEADDQWGSPPEQPIARVA